MSNNELANALAAREAAARDLESAAHQLTLASAAFESSSAAVLAAIPGIASAVGARAKARNSTQWTGDPAATEVEAAQRGHSDRAAGQGAATAAEFAMCQAFANGFGRGSPAETLGYELSPEAAEFLRIAADTGKSRPALTPPAHRFVLIIEAQHSRLRELSKEF